MQDWPKKSKRQRRLLKSEDDDSLLSNEQIAYNYSSHLYEISTVIACVLLEKNVRVRVFKLRDFIYFLSQGLDQRVDI